MEIGGKGVGVVVERGEKLDRWVLEELKERKVRVFGFVGGKVGGKLV